MNELDYNEKVIHVKSKKHGEFDILLDSEDYEKFKDMSWFIEKTKSTFYAGTHIKNKTYRMHRLILKNAEFVDHKDKNGLNNKRSNIRECTISENSRNTRPNRNSSSKFKGVSWHKTGKKWSVQIFKNKMLYRLGLYENENDAALVYNGAAKYLFGEFAHLNEVSYE